MATYPDMLVVNALDHGRPQMASFNPYADNGGSVVAIAGEDYVVLASDTRLSNGFSIYTREQPKLFHLSDTTVLGCTGCWCDTLTLARVLECRMLLYRHEHHKPMSTPAVAQMLSTMLYYKRFFPYYISNILAGLDEEGKGCVFSYDPIGHCERSMFRAGGSAGALLQPLLDNQIGFKNMENVTPEPIPMSKAKAILKDVFISAAERDIYTGDSIYINVITKDGVTKEEFSLRRD
uniref:Proteasome subunit beta type n=1 Tax=Orthoderella ornata TaxID=444751 RepID=A0A481SUY8_9NEOP|nr:proteasome subunit beta type [Orthoderella ornata]